MPFKTSELLDNTDLMLTESMNQMGETQKYRKDYAPFVMTLVNGVLADCFEFNNAMRENKGMEPLEEMPVVRSETDVIPYEYETLRMLMVYRLAYWLLFQDEENIKANAMLEEYELNMQKMSKALYTPIESIW